MKNEFVYQDWMCSCRLDVFIQTELGNEDFSVFLKPDCVHEEVSQIDPNATDLLLCGPLVYFKAPATSLWFICLLAVRSVSVQTCTL